jgi:hypothetical protein
MRLPRTRRARLVSINTFDWREASEAAICSPAAVVTAGAVVALVALLMGLN